MLTDENLKAVSEIFARRMEVVTEHTLQLVGERIKKIHSIGPDEAHLLARLSDVGADAEEIKRYLARATDMNVRDVDTIFKTFAKANYEFMAPYYTARGIEQIAFADNIELQRLIRAEAEVTKGTFRNLSQNAGVTLAGKDGQVLNLSIEEAYQNVVDLSISKVKAGVSSVDAELRSTMKGFADSGIRTINWESGVSRSMYGATRMNIVDGVRQLNMSVRKQTGEEFGADGYEISAHAVCAPDHVPIQGEQYTKHDFEQMDSGLDRPIGTCNCGHYIFPIVMGVSHRTYSREDLDRYARENTEAHIEIDGKKYTSYEVSQLQRRCEANIRNAKNEMKILQAAGDKDGVVQAQQKLTRAQDKYDSISRQSGFGTHISRTNV